MAKHLYHNPPLRLNVVTMNSFRVLIGFLAVSLVTAATPRAADGAAVPGERIVFAEALAEEGPYQTVVMDPDGSNELVLLENRAAQRRRTASGFSTFRSSGSRCGLCPVSAVHH